MSHVLGKELAVRFLVSHLASQHGIYHVHLMAEEKKVDKMYSPSSIKSPV